MQKAPTRHLRRNLAAVGDGGAADLAAMQCASLAALNMVYTALK
jgi:hypothetical protein